MNNIVKWEEKIITNVQSTVFQRNNKLPLDKTDIFTTLSYATRYAAGEDTKIEREINGLTSFAGQAISVVETKNGGLTYEVSRYVITNTNTDNEDGSYLAPVLLGGLHIWEEYNPTTE